MAAPYPTIRLLSGAIATFGPGASVVSCNLFSSLSCLLLNATFSFAAITPDDVKAIFASIKLDDATVIAIHTVNTSTQDAVYVTLRGRNEAKNLVEAFNERTEGKGEGPFRYGHAKTVPPRLPPGTSPVRHISQRVVRISWQRPFSQVWLHFESEETAQRVYRTLDKYKLEPRKESVSEPRIHIFQPPGADSRFLVSWQIGLASGRQGLSPQSLRELFAQDDQPSRIKIGPAVENTFDEEAALAAILDLMTPFGGEEGLPPQSWNYNNRTHMKIHFKHEDDARRAMQELSSTERDFLGGQTMGMQIVSSAQIRVPTHVYNMIGKEMIRVVPNSQQTLSIEVDIDFVANSRFKRIKITGTDEREVAEAMKKMEEVIAGKVIHDEDGLPFWHTLLTDSRVARMIEKEMEDMHRVLIQTNKFKRELRYFGSVSMFEGVREDLLDLITSSTKEKFFFHLNRDEFLWMRRGGYDLLKSTIGDKVVSFDAKVKPHVLMVFGSKWQYQEIYRMITLHTSPTTASANESSTSTECVLCECEAEYPVTTPCNHRYCASCFTNLCTSDTGSIVCSPATAACNSILDLHIIEEHLSSTDFETVLQTSFMKYIADHHDFYSFCSTPDCDNLYQRTTGIAIQETCVQCLLQTCTLCGEQHPQEACPTETGMQTADQLALTEWKNSEDVRDCAKCGRIIEREKGCDHMECKCGGHICWVCSEVFASSRECYDHLKKVHGGVGEGYVLDEQVLAEDAIAHAELEIERLILAGRELVERNEIPAAADVPGNLRHQQRAGGVLMQQQADAVIQQVRDFRAQPRVNEAEW